MTLNTLLAETALRAIATARTKLAAEINTAQHLQVQKSQQALVALLTAKPDPTTWTAEEHVLFMNHGPVINPTSGAPIARELADEIPF